MALNSLNTLRPLRLFLTGLRKRWLAWRTGIRLADNVSMSLTAKFVSDTPGMITIDHSSLIAFKSLIISTDAQGQSSPVEIKPNCFVGGGATILPGVTIGPNSIVGAGAVVFEDVPPFSIVAGNPARVIARDVDIKAFGRLGYADENNMKYWQDKR